MAPSGHTARQWPQSKQPMPPPVSMGCPTSMRMFPRMHTEEHAEQPMHLDESMMRWAIYLEPARDIEYSIVRWRAEALLFHSRTFSFSSSSRMRFLRAVNSGEARSLGLGQGISMISLILAGLFVRTTILSDR